MTGHICLFFSVDFGKWPRTSTSKCHGFLNLFNSTEAGCGEAWREALRSCPGPRVVGGRVPKWDVCHGGVVLLRASEAFQV